LSVEGFFDPATHTVSYLLLDTGSRACALIDSVLDYDPKSGRTRTDSADRLIARVAELGATVHWLLETHVHADHLSAAPYLKAHVGGQIAIGSHVRRVQDVFGTLFNAGPGFAHDGSQFDRLLDDGDTLALGALTIRAMHTPGHTPACMTYCVDDATQRAAFVGDTLFMPDYGTARCDFPGGDARTLYRSIARAGLPADTRLYMCHDYQPGGRDVQFVTTVAEQRRRTSTCGRRERGRFRRHAHRARRHARHAGADPAVGAGQHARRPPAAARKQWRALPEDPAERDLTI
jgi:glyoxylase-like metal-dependent hydrolase (beta-lactamase superfamily II)